VNTRLLIALVLAVSACRGERRQTASWPGRPDSQPAPTPAARVDSNPPIPTAFAIVSGREARSLLAVYDTAGFRIDSTVLRRFPPGQQLLAGVGPGRQIPVRVESLTTEPEYYDPEFYFTPSVPRDWPEDVLAWIPNRPVRLLAVDTVSLPAELEQLLPTLVDSLFRAALLERQPEERPLSFTIKPARALHVAEAADVLLAVVPLDLSGKDWTDNGRASAFVVCDSLHKRVVYAVFGHPEWAPAENSQLITVVPYVFFQVAADPRVYFVGRSSGPWESLENSVFDVRTGRSVLKAR